jgi:hypothetical protein
VGFVVCGAADAGASEAAELAAIEVMVRHIRRGEYARRGVGRRGREESAGKRGGRQQGVVHRTKIEQSISPHASVEFVVNPHSRSKGRLIVEADILITKK